MDFPRSPGVASPLLLPNVVGEMVPKSLALQKDERLACWITPPMLWTKNLLYPFVVTLNGLGNLLLKGIGVNRQAQNADHYYTPEELQLIVQESGELGALRSESSEMLQELFEFGDLTAGQVMVPRVRIVESGGPAAAGAIAELLAEPAHTRYPIIEGCDHIFAWPIRVSAPALQEGTITAAHARAVPVVP